SGPARSGIWTIAAALESRQGASQAWLHLRSQQILGRSRADFLPFLRCGIGRSSGSGSTRMSARSPVTMPRLLNTAALSIVLLAAGCGGPARRLEQARDLALSGHARAALLEARAVLFSLAEKDPKTDEVRRGALKLAGDLCALHLDDARCAAREYRELVK